MLINEIKENYKQFRKDYKNNWNKRQDELWKEILSLILSWKEINDVDIIKIIENEIKQINDSIWYLEKAWKNNNVEEEKIKIEILNKYLPKKLSNDELKNIIKDIIKNNDIKDINKWKWIIFKILKEKYWWKYNWQLANHILNEL